METIDIVIKIYAFIIGACFTSFINVVIDRLPKKESFITGRSHCDSCGKTIKAYDLIPVVSYIILRGKCRYCHQRIPIRGFLLEIFGGLLALLCFIVYGYNINTIIVFLISMVLLAITMIDFDTMEIPNGLIIWMLILSLGYAFNNNMNYLDALMGMLVIALPMYLLTLLIPDCFGGGDIKLMFVSGIALGLANSVLAAFIGIMIGGIYAFYLLLTKKADKQAHMAFGPYLALGIFVSLLYGTQIIAWYWGLFF